MIEKYIQPGLRAVRFAQIGICVTGIGLAGLAWIAFTRQGALAYFSTLALWPLLGAFGLLCVLHHQARRAWRQSRYDGRCYCGHCGYDLRGLPNPRCPECGAGIDQSELSMVEGRAAQPSRSDGGSHDDLA